MTSLTDTQVVTASGGLVELGYGQITSSVTVTSTSFTTPTTVIPDVTVVCDGSPILVEFYAPQTAISSGQSQIVFALWEDGAEKHRYWLLKVNPTGSTGTDYDGVKAEVRLTPSAGSHTYRVVGISSPANNSVLAGSGTTTNSPAFLRVSKIVQATQWPAVTTGTIICTSSTRPASPFEGQQIYETDTDLEYVYNGSSWVSPTSVTPSIANYWSSVSATGFSQVTVAGTPTTVEHDSGDISFDTSTGEYTLPSEGLYMAHFHCSPTSGSPLPMTIVLERTGTMEHPRIAQSADGSGWASYTSINATGIVVANGDRKIRARIFSNNTATFAVWVRIAKIASL